MFKFLFGGVSLKKMVMKKLNAKIQEYQERLDNNLEEIKVSKRLSLLEAWDNYLDKRKEIIRDSEYNKEKIIDTHVTNLLNKVI